MLQMLWFCSPGSLSLPLFEARRVCPLAALTGVSCPHTRGPGAAAGAPFLRHVRDGWKRYSVEILLEISRASLKPARSGRENSDDTGYEATQAANPAPQKETADDRSKAAA